MKLGQKKRKISPKKKKKQKQKQNFENCKIKSYGLQEMSWNRSNIVLTFELKAIMRRRIIIERKND